MVNGNFSFDRVGSRMEPTVHIGKQSKSLDLNGRGVKVYDTSKLPGPIKSIVNAFLKKTGTAFKLHDGSLVSKDSFINFYARITGRNTEISKNEIPLMFAQIMKQGKPLDLKDALTRMDAEDTRTGVKSSVDILNAKSENEKQAILTKYNTLIDDVNKFNIDEKKVEIREFENPDVKYFEANKEEVSSERKLVAQGVRLEELKELLDNLGTDNLSDELKELKNNAEKAYNTKLSEYENDYDKLKDEKGSPKALLSILATSLYKLNPDRKLIDDNKELLKQVNDFDLNKKEFSPSELKKNGKVIDTFNVEVNPFVRMDKQATKLEELKKLIHHMDERKNLTPKMQEFRQQIGEVFTKGLMAYLDGTGKLHEEYKNDPNLLEALQDMNNKYQNLATT